eukprot:CAMPEP_0178465706 /NCGR_PEP_ID=MMETSP0689_2-20121128/51502_1 /TAXON_ID=160604 /ORGANISM="Amphidinium massartii, Strain CS-259" /LENGTH=857 /DNA_ID=CAMNT_0020092659 /DNA_START=122 /DNA_END=2691 /DNA_ORIENTATION=+
MKTDDVCGSEDVEVTCAESPRVLAKQTPPTGTRDSIMITKRASSQKVLEEFDFDGDGIVGLGDLEVAQKQRSLEMRQKRCDRRLIVGLVAAIAILAGAMFGVSFAAVQIAKDMYVSHEGLVQTSSGETVLMGSAEMMVVDGVLYSRADGPDGLDCDMRTGLCGRNAHGKHALATRPAEEKKMLTSMIADQIFANLERVSFEIKDRDGAASMSVTLRVQGFMRTRSNTNSCGSVVRLDVLHGTIILDGAAMHFDDTLVNHFQSQGVRSIWTGGKTAFGRRLDSQQALVLGIFSFFEDYECECFNATEPRSPSLPYFATLLEKRPCLSDDWCKSQIFDGQYLPGYDAESDSILTVVQVLVAEDYSITIQKLPNHPSQELITVTDHAGQTTKHYQMSQEVVTRCYNDSYTPLKVLGVDAWYATYLGEEAREAQFYEILGENYSTAAGANRLFQLLPKNDSDISEPVDYEDDAETLLPKRLFLHSARSEGWDIEEVVTIDLQELDSATANGIFADYESMLVCEGQIKSFPKMKTAFEESISSVAFYVDDMQTNTGMSATEDSYWSYAVAHLTDDFLASYYAALNASIDNSSAAERRLRTRGFTAKFTNSDYLSVGVETDSDHVCVGVAGQSSGNSPWAVDGELAMGDMCGSQDGTFIVSGSVGISYTWGAEKKVLGKKIGCSLSIGGYIGGNTGRFGYDCGRRLGSTAEEGQQLVDADDADLEDEEAEEESGMEHMMALPHLAQGREDADDENAMLVDADAGDMDDDSLDGRRLLFGRRRRRSRRRRRTCYAAGVEVDAGIGIQGSCSAGVSVGVSGSLDINIGPFPQPPLDSKIEGSLSAKACVSLWFASGCVSVGSIDL